MTAQPTLFDAPAALPGRFQHAERSIRYDDPRQNHVFPHLTDGVHVSATPTWDGRWHVRGDGVRPDARALSLAPWSRVDTREEAEAHGGTAHPANTMNLREERERWLGVLGG